MYALYTYSFRQVPFLRSVPALGVDEEVPHVYLILSKVEAGDGFIFMHDECYVTIIAYGADVVPELASMGAVVRGCELEFTDDPYVLGDGVSGDPEGYLQVGSVEDCCRCQFQAHDREVRQRLRFRNTFLTDTGESVVCGHEQVISADVAAGVERWPLGSD